MQNKWKFDSYEQLEKSYIELEKQFTKKCQTVCELAKKIDELKQQQCGTSTVSPPQLPSGEEFFAAFPHAQNFKEQILSKVSDPMYNEKPDAFFRCYVDLLVDKITPHEQLAEDEHFLQQHIISNPMVLEKILQAVQNSRQYFSPVTISGNGGDMSLALPTRPKTIEEASELAKKYFK